MLEEYHSYKEKQRVFSTYTRISTVPEFEKWYASNINLSYKVYYRGVKEAKYKNYTSAQRFCIQNTKVKLPVTEVYHQIQILQKANNNLIERYCASTGIECTDLMLMSIAQHYKNGFSLFLDFTTNLLTALYFMSEGYARKIPQTGTSINNYASIYYSAQLGIPFDKIINDIKIKTKFSEKNDAYDIFQKSSSYTFQQLLSLGIFNILSSAKPIMFESKPYLFNLNHKDYSFSSNVIVSNYNIVAQDGCLLYYDNELTPFEQELCCVDIHKSLIPYIRRKYLSPNHKTKKSLFPKLNNVVDNAFSQILKDYKKLY